MIKKHFNLILIIIALIISVVLGTGYSYLKSALFDHLLVDSSQNSVQSFEEKGINETRNIYNNADMTKVHDLYVTIVSPTKEYKQSASFSVFNKLINSDSEDQTPLHVILQEGDTNGITMSGYSYGENTPNATIQLRGKSTQYNNQKSYKIKLASKASDWNGLRTLNLNKHPFDITRIRNKLSFDYFTKIPGITSLRTNFVRLHIKDLTSSLGNNAKFVDFGLYTNIEQPNKRFLSSHGLDPSGDLYKAENFEFFRYPTDIIPVNSSDYNQKLFEKRLEIHSKSDHTKLIRMLDALNDESKSIDDAFDRYFDKENYLTWMSINLLFGNYDTLTQNFYLYSPMGSEKWYFLPWDYDGAWGWNEQFGDKKFAYSLWQSGISNFSGNQLHRRYFKNPQNLNALIKKIDELGKIINPQTTRSMLKKYYAVVSPIVKNSPDVNDLPGTVLDFEKELKRLENLTQVNKENFFKSLEKPLPIYIGEQTILDEKKVLTWEPSFHYRGNAFWYNIIISKDLEFKNIVLQKSNLTTTNISIDAIPSGKYFVKMKIVDNKGNYMIPFDTYYDVDKIAHFGVKRVEFK